MATAPTLKISAAFRHYTDWQKSCGRKESSIKLNSYAQALLTEYLSAANGMPEEASASESSARAVSEHSTDTTETPLNTRSSSVQCLDQLDRFTIRSFLLWLREEKKLSGSTAQRVYDVLSAMYKFLVAEELIADNPMDKVEKPRREDAPSNLIISGRYILQPEVFGEIEKQEPGAGGEIQITDAMIRLMATSLRYSPGLFSPEVPRRCNSVPSSIKGQAIKAANPGDPSGFSD